MASSHSAYPLGYPASQALNFRSSELLANLLHNFVDSHDPGEVDTEKALTVLTRNDYEPNICFWRKEAADEFTDDTMKHPAPGLVVEILSWAMAKRDRGINYEDYAATAFGSIGSLTPPVKPLSSFS